jgi:hypothetical protein
VRFQPTVLAAQSDRRVATFDFQPNTQTMVKQGKRASFATLGWCGGGSRSNVATRRSSPTMNAGLERPACIRFGATHLRPSIESPDGEPFVYSRLCCKYSRALHYHCDVHRLNCIVTANLNLTPKTPAPSCQLSSSPIVTQAAALYSRPVIDPIRCPGPIRLLREVRVRIDKDFSGATVQLQP